MVQREPFYSRWFISIGEVSVKPANNVVFWRLFGDLVSGYFALGTSLRVFRSLYSAPIPRRATPLICLCFCYVTRPWELLTSGVDQSCHATSSQHRRSSIYAFAFEALAGTAFFDSNSSC